MSIDIGTLKSIDKVARAHEETKTKRFTREEEEIQKFYDDIPEVNAVAGPTIGIYALKGNQGKDVAIYLMAEAYELFKDNKPRIFTYSTVPEVGYVMNLTSEGESLFLELDVLDPRIAETYRKDVTSFDDETKGLDIAGKTTRVGRTKLKEAGVIASKPKTEHVVLNAYSSLSPNPEWNDSAVSVTDSFIPVGNEAHDGDGSPKDTYAFVTRFLQGSTYFGQESLPKLDRELN